MLGKAAVDPNSDENLRRAEAAFVRALEINPDLSIAHNLYAYFEIDSGRAQDAMTRLLARAQARTSDPDLFAGLVHACRYCGLLDASRAADEQARRLDKLIRTSAIHTHFMLGDFQRVHEMSPEHYPAYLNGLALVMLGRDQEAIVALRNSEGWGDVGFHSALLLLMEGRRTEGLAATLAILRPGYRDPESFYYVARQLAYFGDPAAALSVLERAVEDGFFCFSTMARDPWLDPLRSAPAFTRILRRAEARHRGALAAFLQADGDRLLGPNV
jgi:tetratricopeptide (TPR) repeat protein